MLHHMRAGSGPPLLLVHGIGSSHRSFDPVVEALAADFTVVSVDLPGFGDSPLLHRTPTMRALADACAEVVADDGPFAVAGNSLGGGVALHLALDGRARAACALCPVGFVEGWERPWLHVNVRSLAVAFRPVLPFAGSAPVRRLATRVVLAHGERISADQFRDAAQDAKAPGLQPTAGHALNWRAPSVTSLPCPVTIAWGDQDRLLRYGPQAARARERMPSADHVTLEDIGHVPMLDDPALAAKVIRAAVAQTSGRANEPSDDSAGRSDTASSRSA